MACGITRPLGTIEAGVPIRGERLTPRTDLSLCSLDIFPVMLQSPTMTSEPRSAAPQGRQAPRAKKADDRAGLGELIMEAGFLGAGMWIASAIAAAGLLVIRRVMRRR